MEKKIRSKSAISLATFLLIAFTACKKDASLESPATTTGDVTSSAVSATQAIAIAAASRTGSDSIYVVGTCAAHHHTDSIAFGSLPAPISSYLSANYTGYSFLKAYADKDYAGTLSGFVVIVNYNNKPVGLKFDAQGTFVKVLEQREGHDLLDNHGFHFGGHFDDRDGKKRDTIAINALPAAVKSYFVSNYSSDTLVRAFVGRDSSIIVLSTNKGAYSTSFSSRGTFVRRDALLAPGGRVTAVSEEALPAAAPTYLSNTYPNYVFKYAFAIKSSGVTAGFVVLIDANATKYAVEFDAAGNFIKAITIR